MVNSNNSIKILYCYVGMLVLFMNFVQQFFVMSRTLFMDVKYITTTSGEPSLTFGLPCIQADGL